MEYLGIEIHPERDGLLSDFAKRLLKDFYMKDYETTPQQAFARAATCFCAGDYELAQRMYDYASKRWISFSSPVLSNASEGHWLNNGNFLGTKSRAMPISCFLSYVPDTIDGQIDAAAELAYLSIVGGGVGQHLGMRGITEKSPGAIPYLKTSDSNIMYYKQGKCYHPSTEVLTSQGWKLFTDLSDNDLLCVVDEQGNYSFEKPLELVEEQSDGELIRFSNASGFNLLVTPDHSMVVQRKSKWKGVEWSVTDTKVRADEMKLNSDTRIKTSSFRKGEREVQVTPLDRLKIAFQADGYYANKERAYGFRFSKPRKIDRLISILEELGVAYTLTAQKDGSSAFYIHSSELSDVLVKDFSWVDLLGVDSHYANEFVEEVAEWDGHRNREYSVVYTSIDKSCAEVVHTLALLANRYTSISYRERDSSRKDIYSVFVGQQGGYLTTQNVNREVVKYDGPVYCATVSTGRLVVRAGTVSIVCGNTRKGSVAAYLDISHPDIKEFINVRVPTGGDISRKCFNVHNAVNITYDFLRAVEKGEQWELIDPSTGRATDWVDARELWHSILETRFRTGEPYINNIDEANAHLPQQLKDRGMKIHGSNLCNEIHLPTDSTHTAVCCLSSVNLEYFDEWRHTTMVEDCIVFLDNVLQWFIDNAPPELEKAVRSAASTRDLGLGAMGFHSYLQRNMIPFESGGFNSAAQYSHIMFKEIKESAERATKKLAQERAECPYLEGSGRRNAHLLAIAPNANSSIIAGCSPSIEPIIANAFNHRTRLGSVLVKNRYLDDLLHKRYYQLHEEELDNYYSSAWVAAQWKSILDHDGSVQHLSCLTDEEKAVFKTAFEIDQHYVAEFARIRQTFICQGQSVNLFFPAGSSKKYVNSVHMKAFSKEGTGAPLKGLYYLRTNTSATTEKINSKVERQKLSNFEEQECVSCQG